MADIAIEHKATGGKAVCSEQALKHVWSKRGWTKAPAKKKDGAK